MAELGDNLASMHTQADEGMVDPDAAEGNIKELKRTDSGNLLVDEEGGVNKEGVDSEGEMVPVAKRTSWVNLRNRVPTRLSVASQAYDRGNKGFLDPTEQRVRAYDKDGDGKIGIDDVFEIVQDVRKAESAKHSYRRLLFLALAVSIVLLASSFGLTWVAVVLSRDISTSQGNELVVSSTGQVVRTNSRGNLLILEPDPNFVTRYRRNMLGLITEDLEDESGRNDDRELSSGTTLTKLGTGSSSDVMNAYNEYAVDQRPINVQFQVNGVTHTRALNPQAAQKHESSNGDVVFSNIHVQGRSTKYQVQCLNGSPSCDIFEEGTGRMLGNDDCFSPLVVADVEGKGKVAMKDLKVGDRVLTASGSFQKIYAMPHFHQTKPVEYLQIHTKSTAKIGPVEVTPDQMIFLAGSVVPVAAGVIQENFNIQTVNGPEKVTKITKVVRNGLYSPFTTDGTIVVNNIVASVYPTISGEAIVKVGSFATSMHDNIHFLVLPLRTYCSFLSEDVHCMPAEEGRLPYVELALKLFFLWEKYANCNFNWAVPFSAAFLVVETIILVTRLLLIKAGLATVFCTVFGTLCVFCDTSFVRKKMLALWSLFSTKRRNDIETM